jgi:hypothetical protein
MLCVAGVSEERLWGDVVGEKSFGSLSQSRELGLLHQEYGRVGVFNHALPAAKLFCYGTFREFRGSPLSQAAGCGI